MPIELSHLGEDIIAAMLDSLAKRGELAHITCAKSGHTLADDIRQRGLRKPFGFRANDAALTINNGKKSYSCDGEQKVDVLCTGGKTAIAFESKMGDSRMGGSEFCNRFCVRCEISKHSNLRIRGSMIAVLERSLPFKASSRLIARVDNSQWTIAEPWWLVVRQAVFDGWQKARAIPIRAGRVLIFETLADLYGSRQQFDLLVQRVVGSDFAGRWKLTLRDP